MSQELALLIERSTDLKRDLVQFAQGPRFERPLTATLQDAADPEGELDEAVAIGLFEAAARTGTRSPAAVRRAWVPVNGLTQPPHAGHRPAEFILAVSPQTARRSPG